MANNLFVIITPDNIICYAAGTHVGIAHIYKIKRSYPVNSTTEFDFIARPRTRTFSFLRNVFWRNDISLEETTGKQILQHENNAYSTKTYLGQIIYANIKRIVLDEPVLAYTKELYLIHEFIADEKAVGNKDASAFAAMLCRHNMVSQFRARSIIFIPLSKDA